MDMCVAKSLMKSTTLVCSVHCAQKFRGSPPFLVKNQLILIKKGVLLTTQDFNSESVCLSLQKLLLLLL
jgi:hypothetical protein